jgi:1L-myo-inositol 1-phosphate cytidylyltransferase
VKCVIVAAGQGVRLQEKLQLKPLVSVGGKPLIEHVIERARQAGIEEFLVVSGYRGDELRHHLDHYAARTGTIIEHVINEDWRHANGMSVLKAKPFVGGAFLLMMCDHLVDPQIIRDLSKSVLGADSVLLAVDYAVTEPLNDPDDATRVRCDDGRIKQIGKLLPEFDCFDTGVFLCSLAMFDALEHSQSEGDFSISGAINVLARSGRACVLDVTGKIWIDVDDAAAITVAEGLLAKNLL